MSYTNGLDKPSDYFTTKLYSGNGGTQSITGLDFQPDWVWIKQRNAAQSHVLIDSVRGVLKRLRSDQSDAEDTKANSLTAFGTDGFTLGSAYEVNDSSDTYVSGNWKAGTSFTNDASATGIGSIDSTGSVNTTSGFSICSYTGTGSAGTIKHGLSTAPKMIIWKNRSATASWQVYHHTLPLSSGEYQALQLNLTNVSAPFGTYNFMNATAPTSTVFSLDGVPEMNGNGNSIIAYCFAEKQGYSKFGSYTGNDNADGTFVYLGFKPAFVMIKRTNSVNDWIMLDNKRNGFNVVDDRLLANTNAAEATTNLLDFTSTGMKMRATYGGVNGASDNFIYMAFAEESFVSSTGVPATAR